MSGVWRWWTQSDAGLGARIAIGVAFFATFAFVEIRKKGVADSRRWREYGFLAATVGLALVYGILNDQITSSISWEYFYYGKDLAEQLGPQLPPDPLKLHAAAAIVGMKATWTAGLIIGVALLIANNPRPWEPQLSYAKLFALIPMIFAIVAGCAIILGALGYLGLPAIWSVDFRQMLAHDEMRPRKFMMVYGIHLGGYIGGLLAMAIAIATIRRERRVHTLA